MNEQMNHHVNKYSGKTRLSSSSIDETLHSNSNGTFFSSQAFVDDIPFEFNPKYRTIHVPNIHVPDYDTQTIQNLLSTTIDFSLEKRVLEEALEDLKRKKKEIEADSIAEPLSKSSKTNCQVSDPVSITPKRLPESVPLTTILPPLAPAPSPTPVVSLPSSSTVPSFPSIHPNPPISNSHSTYSSPSNSYRLPSVRDIYWPTTNQQQYTIPSTTTNHPLPASSINYPSAVPPPIPTPVRLPPAPTPPLPPLSSSFHPSMITKPTTATTTVSVNPSTASSMKNSINTNELAVTFDETLTSDDPFHDAELKSLNDVAELNHLYSAYGAANTVRR